MHTGGGEKNWSRNEEQEEPWYLAKLPWLWASLQSLSMPGADIAVVVDDDGSIDAG
jgi:hypothetical protein